MKKAGASASAAFSSAAQPKKTGLTGEIKFASGPPKKFARGKQSAQFGGAFSGGLDELEEDGAVKKRNKDTGPAGEGNAASEGGRAFVNLSSSAKAGDYQRGPEEEKRSDRPTGIKPTFRGKANLTKTGGGQDDENAGVVTSYGFAVALRGPRSDDKEEGKGGEEGQARRGGRGGRDKGRPFGEAGGQDEDSDDGFAVVQDKAGTRRQARQRNAGGDSDGSDDGFSGSRGGGRGGRGGRGSRGGGFFTNSSRAAGDAKD